MRIASQDYKLAFYPGLSDQSCQSGIRPVRSRNTIYGLPLAVLGLPIIGAARAGRRTSASRPQVQAHTDRLTLGLQAVQALAARLNVTTMSAVPPPAREFSSSCKQDRAPDGMAPYFAYLCKRRSLIVTTAALFTARRTVH